jgi:hypothetical protein
MPVSNFPTRANTTYPSEPQSQQHLKLDDDVPEYAVVTKQFKDKGVNKGLLSVNTVQKWIFKYDGLSDAEAAVFDAHYAEAQGEFAAFNFRHPRSLVLYSSVFYESYVKGHTKVGSVIGCHSREITLVKYP